MGAWLRRSVRKVCSWPNKTSGLEPAVAVVVVVVVFVDVEMLVGWAGGVHKGESQARGTSS